MRIFISSTFKDLRPERQAVQDVLRRAALVPWGMELFASEPSAPLEVALRELELSDAVILIVGFKAGSLIPENAGLTYTAAEFHRARDLGRPIFAFLHTEGGNWTNKETETALWTALDGFVKGVRDSDITPAYFETTDQLQTEALLTIERWNAEGRPGARKVFTTPKEFFAPLKKAGAPRLFDFDQTLRGRTTEIDSLNAFVSSPDQFVALLIGRGGIGKSKLLHDWVRGQEIRKVIYVRDDASWHPECAKEIPRGDVIIVADDAHRLECLENLLSLVRHLNERQTIKLILAVRPSAVSHLDAALATRFDPAEVQRFPVLERLTIQSVTPLAEEVLGPGHLQYAPALARVSADTPLVTVVGGRLIARGDIQPTLLANEDEFRHAIFDRFSAEYEKLLPPGPVNWRNLLNLIAALSPLRPNTDAFLTAAGELLHSRADEIVSAIDTLEQHGLLLRGGNLIRIVPDVLSDYLLEGGCLTRAGTPTGFADVVFQRFHSSYLSNILRNLAELDWRIAHRDDGPELLSTIWLTLEHTFENGDAAERVQLLQSLQQTALFQPRRALALIHRAIAMEARPVNPFGLGEINQRDVLRAVPPLLDAIAHHLDFLNVAVSLLWQLAAQDVRPPHQYPSHASRILSDLASYGRYKPVILNERIADIMAELAREPDAFNRAFTPLEIADKLLAKEAEFHESDGLTFSMGSLPLNYLVIRPIREKAIAVIRATLFLDDPKAASRAVGSLSHILSGFLPMFVRQAGAEEHAWQDGERLQALDIIESRLRHTPLPIPLARQISVTLRHLRPRGRSDALAQRFGALLALVPQSDELLIFDTFATASWERDAEYTDLAEAQRHHEEWLKRGVELFRQRHPRPEQQIQELMRMASDVEAAGIDVNGKSGDFISALCGDPEFLGAFSTYLLRVPSSSLGHFMRLALRALRETNLGEYRRVGLDAASHDNVYVAHGAANAICFGPALNAPITADAEIIAQLSQHANSQVRYLTFTGIGRIGEHPAYRSVAAQLLLSTETAEDPGLAEQMCGALDYGYMDPRAFSRDEVRGVLRKLVLTKEIDSHHIGRFLVWVGQTYPSDLFEFIIQRLDHSASLTANTEGRSSYRPIPHHQIGTNFHALRGTPQYGQFLAEVRDRLIAQPEQGYWLLNLFWAIGALDTMTLSALDEWLHSRDVDKVRAIIALLGQAPPEFALTRPYFAIHLLQTCQNLDHNLGERASSLLNNLVFEALLVSSFEFWLSCKGVVWVFLSTEPAHPRHVSCSGHQVSQSAQIVGGPGKDKQPSHLVDSSQLHFL